MFTQNLSIHVKIRILRENCCNFDFFSHPRQTTPGANNLREKGFSLVQFQRTYTITTWPHMLKRNVITMAVGMCLGRQLRSSL